MDPDQERHFVGLDLDPNCLQRLSEDDKKSTKDDQNDGLLCMLGNFLWFCCGLLTFFKINFFKNYFRNTINVSNLWQRLLADDKSLLERKELY